ncbi:MAG: hypothetical protein RR473_13080 [Comamonas sp.]
MNEDYKALPKRHSCAFKKANKKGIARMSNAFEGVKRWALQTLERLQDHHSFSDSSCKAAAQTLWADQALQPVKASAKI